MFQIAIDWNVLQSDVLECNTFAERLKKAKKLTGFSQNKLSNLTGVSLSTINELEAGYRDTIKIETLNKLLTVLDKDILCDDYYLYILNQEENMNALLSKYGITKLCNMLKSHHSTVYRWIHGQYQINRKKYSIIKTLDHD